MLFAHAAVQSSELLHNGDGTAIEGTSIEGEILLSASGVWGCSYNVQQYILLVGAGEHCVIEVSNAQSTRTGS